MKKIILLIGIMLFVANHSFARDIADDLKARQGQFIEELGDLSDQEGKVVKSINDSIDKYSKSQDPKTLQQILDSKTKLINVLRKEEDAFQGYIGSLEKELSDITNKEFTPLGKGRN